MDFLETSRSEIKLKTILFDKNIFEDIDEDKINIIAKDYKNGNGEYIEYLKEKMGLNLINNKLEVEVI